MADSSKASGKRQRKPKVIPAELPKDGLVREWVVLAFYPVSDETLRRDVKAGKFPKPIKIGKRAIAWDAATLHQHFDRLREAA